MRKKKKILIIDDEESFTKLVKLNLEATGEYVVIPENNSSHALTAAKQSKPDLILMDILMPDIDGDNLWSQLDSDTETKNIPRVFLSAAVDRREGDSPGGDMARTPFIVKPVSTRELIAVIKQHLG